MIDALWGVALGALRVGPSVMLLPLSGLGPASWPARVALSLCLAAGALASPAAPWSPAWWLPCARELLVGTVLALVLALPWMALEHASSMLSLHGAAMAVAGRVTAWAGALTFVAARGHHGALRVLAASWAVLPPGGAWPTGDASLRAAVEATAEALAGGLLVASSGLLAVVAAELVAALVARFSWPVTREGAGGLRALVGIGVVALGLRAAAEVAVALGQRSHAIAAGMR